MEKRVSLQDLARTVNDFEVTVRKQLGQTVRGAVALDAINGIREKMQEISSSRSDEDIPPQSDQIICGFPGSHQ
jgi:hypothetical protein